MQTSDMNVPLRHESNVLVAVRIYQLSTTSTMNLWLALASVVYCAINIACITFIAIESATSEQIFHNTEERDGASNSIHSHRALSAHTHCRVISHPLPTSCVRVFLW